MGSFRNHVYRDHKEWLSSTEPPPDLVHSSVHEDPVGASGSDVGAVSSSGAAESTPESPQEQEAVAEEASDRFSLQRLVCDVRKWITKLFYFLAEKQKVPHTTCEKLFLDIEVLLQSSLRRFAEYIKHELAACCSPVPESLAHIFDCAFLQEMFDGIRSQYQRTEYAKATLPYTEPQQCSYAADDQRPFSTFPLPVFLRNFVSARMFSHILKMLRLPKLEFCEASETALCTKTNRWKHCCCRMKCLAYLALLRRARDCKPTWSCQGQAHAFCGVLQHTEHTSKVSLQLRLLHIAIIAKYPDVKKHGLPATFRPLLQELSELQSNGITISVNGKDVCLKVSVLACAGDNLSMNRLGGFTCSFSRGSVCRFCMAQSSQLPTLTREGLCQVRTKELHQSHLTAVELNPALYKRLYGVNAPSSMSCLGNFDPTSQLPPDIMHDLFEGAFPFVVQHTVMGLLQGEILSESDLDKIATFQYGCNDRKNRPSELTVSLLKDKGVVTGTATQKWCLFRLLPQIFSSSVPEGNLKWEVYLLLREVADIILAYEMPADALAYLETKIQEFIRTFVECYPNQRLIPKLHYLIHYPRMISFFGPLHRYGA
ncbi:hypothetical protein HPB48_023364 [Haemaphysalis longicornis]|uniref:Uncharacterized protein n=1 Tax=Haemaphysalis longicornis TaxID=44386 RepID=A0A9J6H642_HAELO|nr:hypothetical protein HPB48_023364 [Haemaphysalis longicornis]